MTAEIVPTIPKLCGAWISYRKGNSDGTSTAGKEACKGIPGQPCVYAKWKSDGYSVTDETPLGGIPCPFKATRRV
jgi:hypothetical protein